MKKKRKPAMTEKQVRAKLRWSHATLGVQAGVKAKGGIKQANALLGTGQGGIEDAMMPAWKRKRLLGKK